MDFDREYDLENAGIDAFDFSLMDEDERREALEDAGLDPDDYEDIEFDSSFSAWSDLQMSGSNLWELELMDDDEKRETIENAGLDPEDFDLDSSPYVGSYPTYSSEPHPPEPQTVATSHPDSFQQKHEPDKSSQPKANPNHSSQQNEATEVKPPRKIYHFCGVRFEGGSQIYSYLTGNISVRPGDTVRVPVGSSGETSVARVVSIGDYTAEAAPYPVEKTKQILSLVVSDEAKAVTKPVSERSQRVSRQSEIKTINRKMRKLRAAIVVLSVLLLVLIAVIIYSYSGTNIAPIVSPSVSSPRVMQTSSPVPTATPKPTATPTPKPTASARNSGPHVGMKLSRDDGLYFLGGGGKVGGVSTSKFRYTYGSKTYVVYLDNDYVIQKIEDYLPQSSNKKSSSTPKPTSDPYDAKSYSHPEDFYYDYYDDFWDYEDAEDYWEDHK